MQNFNFKEIPLKNFKELKEFLLKKPEITTCLIPAVIIMFYLCLFLLPSIKNSFRLIPQVSQLKSKIISVEKEWADVDSFNKKISHLHEKLDYYERSLPGEKEIPAVLEYLSAAAKELNVRITEIRPVGQDENKVSAHSIYYKVPILLKAECGYHQLGRFLDKLENADRFIRIDDIKIESDPDKSDIHNVELIVATYVMRK